MGGTGTGAGGDERADRSAFAAAAPAAKWREGEEGPITSTHNHHLAILQFAIRIQKPPAPVALQGRLCLSGKRTSSSGHSFLASLPFCSANSSSKALQKSLVD